MEIPPEVSISAILREGGDAAGSGDPPPLPGRIRLMQFPVACANRLISGDPSGLKINHPVASGLGISECPPLHQVTASGVGIELKEINELAKSQSAAPETWAGFLIRRDRARLLLVRKLPESAF